MPPDSPAQVSLPLAHDHFRSIPGSAHGVEPVSNSSIIASGIRRAQHAPRLAGVAAAKLAAAGAKHATLQAIRGARWSGSQTIRLGKALREQLARAGADSASAKCSSQPSRYASVPNRLSALAALSEQHCALVRSSLPGHAIHQAGSTLLAEGERTPHSKFILSGWVARTRVQGGKMHVLGILLPGDGINLFGPPCAVANSTLIALTMVETADATQMLEIMRQAEPASPLRLSMRRVMAEDEAFLMNQTMRLMMKAAPARLAHLLLELQYRLARAGMVRGAEMPLALDRRTLAAALGLSPRDVMRVVHKLERRKIARFRHNRLAILREDVLQKLGGFTPPAFSEGSGRQLITDDCAREIEIEPRPRVSVPADGSSQTRAAWQRAV